MSKIFQPLFSENQNLESSAFKLFDWQKCVDLICEHKIKNARFGLYEDWHMTSATGLENGRPAPGTDGSDIGTFLGSWWATPYLVDLDTQNEYPCFKEIDEKDFTDDCIKASEDWWPKKAAEYFADKCFGDN